MNLNLTILDSQPDSEIVRALGALRDSDMPLDARHAFALKHLRSAQADRVRNAAATALADTGCLSAAGDIVDILRQPGMAAVAGTLLYAMEELGGDLPLDVFVHVLVEGSYEARQQALDLLRAGQVIRSQDDDIPALRGRLMEMMASSDEERRAAAEQALAALIDDATPPP